MTTKVKHKKPDFMLKYFAVLQVLLRLANFDAIEATEKRSLIKLLIKFKKTKRKNYKPLYHFVIYLSRICYLRINACF